MSIHQRLQTHMLLDKAKDVDIFGCLLRARVCSARACKGSSSLSIQTVGFAWISPVASWLLDALGISLSLYGSLEAASST